MSRTQISIILLLLSFVHAFADDGKKCEGIDLETRDKVSFARVVPGYSKVNFIKGSEGGINCPSDLADCKKRSFVVEGDVLLVQKIVGDYVCAEFTNKKNYTSAGFLPARSLVETSAPVVSVGAWVGKWRGNGEQNIEIKRGVTAGKLSVSGDATYGALDPARVKRGAVNTGSLDAEAAPTGPIIHFIDGQDAKSKEPITNYSCKVRMQLVGKSLLVVDNSRCGGMNVTFTGTYSKR